MANLCAVIFGYKSSVSSPVRSITVRSRITQEVRFCKDKSTVLYKTTVKAYNVNESNDETYETKEDFIIVSASNIDELSVVDVRNGLTLYIGPNPKNPWPPPPPPPVNGSPSLYEAIATYFRDTAIAG
jgi:hypothetical protein